MSMKQKFKHSIYQLLKRKNVGSYNTQADRKSILLHAVDDLQKIGMLMPDVYSLKPKHVTALVDYWKTQGLSSGTLKNRMSAVRFVFEATNKSSLLPTNDQLGIEKRSYKPTFNRALNTPDFSTITDRHLYHSLQLQRVFGLRREECIKMQPHIADQGDRIQLLAAWCKGGRSRVIPILNNEQRFWLDEAKKFVKKINASMIPKEKTYIQQRYIYDKQSQRAGLKNLHGLRHAYAQKRYEDLTGFPPPIAGGPSAKELTPEQKERDDYARSILSGEMAHSRR